MLGHQSNQKVSQHFCLFIIKVSYTPEQVAAMAKTMHAGDIGKVATVTGDQSAIVLHPNPDCDKKI